MSLLDRYIGRTLLAAISLVMVVLMVLGGLFIFIGEQSDIGTGHYGALQALSYSLMNLPQFALQALPAGALIGAMLGMGTLGRSSELTVMRAAGMSKARLALSTTLAALFLIVVAVIWGEWVAPPLERLADQNKAIARYNNVSFAGKGGAWIRDGERILNIERLSASDQLGGIMIYELTPDHRLVSIARAERATGTSDREWQLHGYVESRFGDHRVEARHEDSRPLLASVGSGFLQLVNADPSNLSILTLTRVIRYLRANHLRDTDYVFALWSQAARHVAVLAALLFALPLAFGSLRSAGAGARTTLGLVIGLVYFFAQRMVESGVSVFALDPVLLAWLPCAGLALAAAVLYARAR